MNIKTALITATMLALPLMAQEPTAEALTNAIAKVESNHNDNAIGDNGKAVGRYQIWKVVVDDVNRIIGKEHFTYADRFDAKKSRQMFAIYTAHYCKVYERKTGRKATAEVKARIWNGGPNGWRKSSTDKYWRKVKACL